MKKYAMIFAVLILAVGCSPKSETEVEKERVERVNLAKKKIQFLQEQFHACDKNEGVKDIDGYNCYKGGCRAVMIECNDGMSKIMDKEF
jgi:hypothetical protein